MYYFTSITANYTAKAKVLCKSLKRHNRDAFFVLVISGEVPEDVVPSPGLFDYILNIDDIRGIRDPDIFKFKYNITELCTAVKPYAARQILEDFGADSIIYLDPDIKVFGPLTEAVDILKEKSMVFTPHQTRWEEDHEFIKSNDILFLKRGTMNLGFFGVKNDAEGRSFLDWWADRLQDYCFDDDSELQDVLEKERLLGLFTDQKWIDLVPSYFENHHILRDPGYNMCTWNMTHRTVVEKDSGYEVNGRPLRFFHFSGYDSGGHVNELRRNLEANPKNGAVQGISDEYARDLVENNDEAYKKIGYTYSFYDNGKKIKSFERKILLIYRSLHMHFPNPFSTAGDNSYHDWVRRNYRSKYPRSERRFHDDPVLRKIAEWLLPMHSRRHAWVKKIYNDLRGKGKR